MTEQERSDQWAKGMRLVRKLAREFYVAYWRPDITLDDFIGWGVEGLKEALKRCDPERPGFGQFSYWRIKYALQKGVAEWAGHKRNSPPHVKKTVYLEYDDDTEYSITTPVEERYDRMELWDQLMQLPPDLCLPLILHMYYELEPFEIRFITGIPTRKVSGKIKTAIDMLRDKYNAGSIKCADGDNEGSLP